MEPKKRTMPQAAVAALREKQAAGEVAILDPIEKAQRNPTSLRLAINGKCWDCIGGNADPGPRQRIRDCQMHDCTLHPVRPFQNIKSRAPTLDLED